MILLASYPNVNTLYDVLLQGFEDYCTEYQQTPGHHSFQQPRGDNFIDCAFYDDIIKNTGVLVSCSVHTYPTKSDDDKGWSHNAYCTITASTICKVSSQIDAHAQVEITQTFGMVTAEEIIEWLRETVPLAHMLNNRNK